MDDKNNVDDYDELDLPKPPRIHVYKETFGGIVDITDEWYKENGD